MLEMEIVFGFRKCEFENHANRIVWWGILKDFFGYQKSNLKRYINTSLFNFHQKLNSDNKSEALSYSAVMAEALLYKEHILSIPKLKKGFRLLFVVRPKSFMNGRWRRHVNSKKRG